MLGSNLNVNSGDRVSKLDISMREAGRLIEQPDTDAGNHNATDRTKVPNYVCKHCQEAAVCGHFLMVELQEGELGDGKNRERWSCFHASFMWFEYFII